jgi:hypothetical protein
MSDVIERVARALDPLAWAMPDHEETAFRRLRSLEQSYVAIKALAEPTEPMLTAAEGALGEWRKTLTRDEAMARSYQAHDRKFIASATPAEKHMIRWRAMIEAALRSRNAPTSFTPRGSQVQSLSHPPFFSSPGTMV